MGLARDTVLLLAGKAKARLCFLFYTRYVAEGSQEFAHTMVAMFGEPGSLEHPRASENKVTELLTSLGLERPHFDSYPILEEQAASKLGEPGNVFLMAK